MKYKTENEFEHFVFEDAHIQRLECVGDMFHLYLDDVGILPENSCNRDIRKMRANGLLFRILDMKILKLEKEGYSYYDANGKFLRKEDDIVIASSAYGQIMATFSDGYVVEIKKENCIYTITMDSNDECTYELVVEGSQNIEEWDRFLSADNS